MSKAIHALAEKVHELDKQSLSAEKALDEERARLHEALLPLAQRVQPARDDAALYVPILIGDRVVVIHDHYAQVINIAAIVHNDSRGVEILK